MNFAMKSFISKVSLAKLVVNSVSVLNRVLQLCYEAYNWIFSCYLQIVTQTLSLI